MTWPKTSEDIPLNHGCLPPVRTRVQRVPRRPPGADPLVHRTELVPDAAGGAVWMCDECKTIWACRAFATYNRGRQVGLEMRWEKVNVILAWWKRRKFLNNQTGG